MDTNLDFLNKVFFSVMGLKEKIMFKKCSCLLIVCNMYIYTPYNTPYVKINWLNNTYGGQCPCQNRLYLT